MTSPTTAREVSPSRPLLRAENRLERRFPDLERLVELGVADHERAEHPDAVAVHARLQQQQSALERRLGDLTRELRSRLPRGGIADELDREHRAEAPHVADLREPLLPGAHACPDRLADLDRALDEPRLLDHVEDGKRR